MLSVCRLVVKRQVGLRFSVRVAGCGYHTYPEPDEVPIISTHKAEPSEKKVDKSLPNFKLNDSYGMSKVFPGIPISQGIIKTSPPATRSTVLANGLTVATQEMPGMMSSFAFLVRTGSSYESQSGAVQSTGCTHFLELNGFKTTENRQHLQLVEEMESLGGMVQTLSTRENLIYCVDVLRPNTERALDILADAVLRPRYPEEEVAETRELVALQSAEMPAEILSRDLVQRAAYSGSPLGNTHFCPLDKVQAVTSEALHAFRRKHFFGGNCIVSAAGVEHEAFVALVRDKFATLPAGDRSAIDAERGQSTFTGGLVSEQRPLKEPFVKLAMAFEVGGWDDPLLVATCVLQQLLGGGSSFSAGGPGKGMYTRLYTQVLNRSHWAESVESFVSIHEARGLFGIDAACPPEYLSSVVRVVVEQFTLLALEPVSAEELGRAKNMLKSMMMMQLESRLVLCEDIGRQFITYGKRELPAAVCAKIDAVTAADLQAVADRMMQQPPAVGVVGHDLSHMPSYQDIHTFVQKYRFEAWRSKK